MSPDSPRPSATRRAWRAMSALGCVLGAASILFSVVLFNEIQNSRTESVRMQCVEQNARHDQAITTLDVLIAKVTDPAKARRAREGRPSTILLIEALQPRRDCAKRVERFVK